jgi:ribosomal protein S18 acetylase RimI-like enzyme
MTSIIFEKAVNQDAPLFAKIAKRAFDSDANVGGSPGGGGPPGYDTTALYTKLIRVSKAFYKMILDEKIIGGFIIFDVFDGSQSHCELGMIFIDPDFQHKGYGIQAMSFLEKTYSNIKKWSLGTPSWNIRTFNFYQKCGYKILKRDSKECLFEKNIQ